MIKKLNCLFIFLFCLNCSEVLEAKYLILDIDADVLLRRNMMINLPYRQADFVNGSTFINNSIKVYPSNLQKNIELEMTKGNMPAFIAQLIPIVVMSSSDVLTYFVTSDYLSIGDENDYVRMPMMPKTAQNIADKYNCILPTSKMVEDIWKSSVKLKPIPFPPNGSMTTLQVFKSHHDMIQNQDFHINDLISGHKKDIVITNKLKPGKVAIFGWFDNKKPIQPLSTIHGSDYYDYSHGVRLVSKKAILNNEEVQLVDILSDEELCSLVSYEGVVSILSY